jgi:hypothetical protein
MVVTLPAIQVTGEIGMDVFTVHGQAAEQMIPV